MLRKNIFQENAQTRRELEGLRGLKKTSVLNELNDLIAAGLLEVDNSTPGKPRYYLTDNLKRAPPETQQRIVDLVTEAQKGTARIPPEAIPPLKDKINQILLEETIELALQGDLEARQILWIISADLVFGAHGTKEDFKLDEAIFERIRRKAREEGKQLILIVEDFAPPLRPQDVFGVFAERSPAVRQEYQQYLIKEVLQYCLQHPRYDEQGQYNILEEGATSSTLPFMPWRQALKDYADAHPEIQVVPEDIDFTHWVRHQEALFLRMRASQAFLVGRLEEVKQYMKNTLQLDAENIRARDRELIRLIKNVARRNPASRIMVMRGSLHAYTGIEKSLRQQGYRVGSEQAGDVDYLSVYLPEEEFIARQLINPGS
ncbi:MAG: hypothetical protein Q8O36_01760, partial [Candidatus Omnitrophota bacterium]|nr:hypothetical protein [Candidatus Omnitrophota bacterium]